MLPNWTNPQGVYVPQAHYAQVAEAGGFLYVSGLLAFDIDGTIVGVGDAGVQARQVWKNLGAVLESYGLTWQHLVKTGTFITHWAYRQPVADARDEVFPHPPYPANTLVVVQGLADPQLLVEIEAVALLAPGATA